MSSLAEIHTHYPLNEEQIADFRTNGFVKLSSVLSRETLHHYGKEITEKVSQLNKQTLPMSKRTTYKKAFIQIINLWKKSEVVKEFAFGKRLARIASELMGVHGVRIYHDQALYKEPGGGFTPWHADQFYWPFASEKCCTVWVPLQDTPLEMGPLAFSKGSHRFEFGRNMNISDESEEKIQAALDGENYPYVQEGFELGEVSFHCGWTYHRAAGNSTDRPRRAITMIYMDRDMRLKEADNEHQKPEIWCPGVSVGEIIETDVTPVLYDSQF